MFSFRCPSSVWFRIGTKYLESRVSQEIYRTTPTHILPLPLVIVPFLFLTYLFPSVTVLLTPVLLYCYLVLHSSSCLFCDEEVW